MSNLVQTERVCSQDANGAQKCTMRVHGNLCIDGKPKCRKGTYRVAGDDHCELCPVGQYQDMEEKEGCKSCPSGTSTGSAGANAVSDCKALGQTSCANVATSTTITVKGETVYCFVGDNGKWALINAWNGRYKQTTGRYGSCGSSNAMNCKLSDSVINHMVPGTRVYRFTGGSATNMYIKTANKYVDTATSFNISPTSGSTRAKVMGSYSTSLDSACRFSHNWIDFLYIHCGGQGEGNNRWFFGHGSNDCYAEANGYRCAKGGSHSGYGQYGRIPNVRMYVKVA